MIDTNTQVSRDMITDDPSHVLARALRRHLARLDAQGWSVSEIGLSDQGAARGRADGGHVVLSNSVTWRQYAATGATLLCLSGLRDGAEVSL